MKDEIEILCAELDDVITNLDLVNDQEKDLKNKSYEIDAKLHKILHAHIDPLLKGRWKARIVLYKDGK